MSNHHLGRSGVLRGFGAWVLRGRVLILARMIEFKASYPQQGLFYEFAIKGNNVSNKPDYQYLEANEEQYGGQDQRLNMTFSLTRDIVE